jgi:hypothetical protein
VAIQASATLGINVQSSGGFTEDSGDVVVTGGGSKGVVTGGIDTSHPVYIEAPSIHTLPPGEYAGNAKDAILARTPFVLDADETFHDRGIPYQIVYTFDMAPQKSEAEGGLTTLTLDPGVTLRFGGPLYTTPALRLGSGTNPLPASNYPARLVANGTAEKPIVLTSGAPTPAPGDWIGVKWMGGVASGNVMSHVRIEYGGAGSGAEGFGCGPKANDALLLMLAWRPGNAFIQNSTFAHSAAGAILSGWDSDQAGPDFRATNTFTEIADSCQISQNRNAMGQCPGNDSTPDCY